MFRSNLNPSFRLARLLCQAPGDSAHLRRLTQLLSIFNKRDEAIEKLLSVSVEKCYFEENSLRAWFQITSPKSALFCEITSLFFKVILNPVLEDL